MQIPLHHYGRIADKSSMALRGIIIGAGVVEPDYTGSIKVVLHNLRDVPVVVERGEKIAQLIFEKCSLPKEMAWVDDMV